MLFKYILKLIIKHLRYNLHQYWRELKIFLHNLQMYIGIEYFEVYNEVFLCPLSRISKEYVRIFNKWKKKFNWKSFPSPK